MKRFIEFTNTDTFVFVLVGIFTVLALLLLLGVIPDTARPVDR